VFSGIFRERGLWQYPPRGFIQGAWPRRRPRRLLAQPWKGDHKLRPHQGELSPSPSPLCFLFNDPTAIRIDNLHRSWRSRQHPLSFAWSARRLTARCRVREGRAQAARGGGESRDCESSSGFIRGLTDRSPHDYSTPLAEAGSAICLAPVLMGLKKSLPADAKWAPFF
jgi:hypothetical protein